MEFKSNIKGIRSKYTFVQCQHWIVRVVGGVPINKSSMDFKFWIGLLVWSSILFSGPLVEGATVAKETGVASFNCAKDVAEECTKSPWKTIADYKESTGLTQFPEPGTIVCVEAHAHLRSGDTVDGRPGGELLSTFYKKASWFKATFRKDDSKEYVVACFSANPETDPEVQVKEWLSHHGLLESQLFDVYFCDEKNSGLCHDWIDKKMNKPWFGELATYFTNYLK